MSNPSGDGLADYLKELYGEDEAVDNKEIESVYVKEEEHFFTDDEDEKDPVPSTSSSLPAAPLNPPLVAPECGQVQRQRSRSPNFIGLDPNSDPNELASSGIVLHCHEKLEMPPEDEVENELETFMCPDAHNLYARVEGMANVEDSSLSRGGRTRERRGRGPIRSRGEGRRQRATCQASHPLQEIWMTDDDVPVELREMVRDVIRRRQTSTTLKTADNDDIFYDAVDGRDHPLLPGDFNFDWFPMKTFRGEEEIFRAEQTGSVTTYSNPYEAFRSFWDDDILSVVVNETNRYASTIQSTAFKSEWHPTNSHEVLCLFAFWMMSGIIRMPTSCSYFSQHPFLKTEIFTRITTLKRYNNLNRALHFVDPATNKDINTDPIHRLRPIIDHLNSKFKSKYILSKDIRIGESLNFKQNIKLKVANIGIKTFELYECATGYLWSFVVHAGKSNFLNSNQSRKYVCDLIKPLLNKGYRLFMDNWFNSPLFARYLKRNGTDCVGTLLSNAQHVPQLVTQAPLKQGQLVARHSGDVCVLSWQDKERVNMISTCHGSATGLPMVASYPPARPLPYKPQVVLDYSKAMAGADQKEQMLEPYLLEGKHCGKWYLKLFKRLLNCSIHNSLILLECSLKTRQDNLKFRLELVHYILTHHLSLVPVGRRAKPPRHPASTIPPQITNNTHWPVKVEASNYEAAHNRQGRHRCVLCTKYGRENQRTRFKCEACDVPLCVDFCFKYYHTAVQ